MEVHPFLGASGTRGRRPVLARERTPDFDAAGVEERPGLSGMFARLGVLLVIALGFGLAAQLLVGAPH